MDDHVGLRVIQNIDDKRGPFGQPIGDLPSPLEGHANLRGIEGTLLHPARQHAGLGVSTPRGDDEHTADDPAQGGQQLLFGIGSIHNATRQFLIDSPTSFSTSSNSKLSLKCLISLPSGPNTKKEGAPSNFSFCCQTSSFSSKIRFVKWKAFLDSSSLRTFACTSFDWASSSRLTVITDKPSLAYLSRISTRRGNSLMQIVQVVDQKSTTTSLPFRSLTASLRPSYLTTLTSTWSAWATFASGLGAWAMRSVPRECIIPGFTRTTANRRDPVPSSSLRIFCSLCLLATNPTKD